MLKKGAKVLCSHSSDIFFWLFLFSFGYQHQRSATKLWRPSRPTVKTSCRIVGTPCSSPWQTVCVWKRKWRLVKLTSNTWWNPWRMVCVPWEEEEYRWNENSEGCCKTLHINLKVLSLLTPKSWERKTCRENSDHGKRGHILIFIANQPITFSCGNNMFGSWKIIFIIILYIVI